MLRERYFCNTFSYVAMRCVAQTIISITITIYLLSRSLTASCANQMLTHITVQYDLGFIHLFNAKGNAGCKYGRGKYR